MLSHPSVFVYELPKFEIDGGLFIEDGYLKVEISVSTPIIRAMVAFLHMLAPSYKYYTPHKLEPIT